MRLHRIPQVDFSQSYLMVNGEGNREIPVPFGREVRRALWHYIASYRPKPEYPQVTQLFLSEQSLTLRPFNNMKVRCSMVKMSSKLLFGTDVLDWQEGINVSRMREARAERARQIMREHGIAAMLATQGDNCRYLTGLRGPDFLPQLWYVLFLTDDDPVVFPHAGWLHQMPDQAPWIKKWRIARSWLGGICGSEATREEAKLFASDIYQELKESGLTGEKLAIVGFDAPAREALGQLGITLVDGWPIMLEATAVKTEDEINCLKMVAAICEAAWYRVWETLRPGMREIDISHIATRALHNAGAHTVPSNACRSGPLTFERGIDHAGRIIQSGDLLYLNMCGVTYLGYRSCTIRTLIAGRNANDKERGWYKRLLERLNAVIDAIRPGATTADAAKHLPPATAWGYQDEAEVLALEIGHGIGLHGYEMPIINRQWSLEHPQVFEPGMTLAIEGREGEFRIGGVSLENMVVVTKEGAEIIDHMPRDHILEPMVSHRWG